MLPEMAEHQNDNAKPSDKNVVGAPSAYTINLDNFQKRLKVFYSHWKEHQTKFWGASDVLVIASPPASDDLRYLKSSALNVWLLGYEFPETIIVFMEKQIHFLCTQKKASLLGTLKKSAREAVNLEIVIHVKAKSDDGSALMDEAAKGTLKAGNKVSVVYQAAVLVVERDAPEFASHLTKSAGCVLLGS